MKQKIIDFLKKIKNPFDMRDYFIFGGLLLMGIGLGQVAPWLAFAVVGFLLFLAGIFADKLVNPKFNK